MLMKQSLSDYFQRLSFLLMAVLWFPLMGHADKLDPVITLEGYDYEVKLGQSFTPPKVTIDPPTLPIYYVSSDEAVAKVDKTTGAVTLVGVGFTWISVATDGNDDYNGMRATYTLTVKEADGGGSGGGSVTTLLPPVFSHDSGTYTEAFTLTITNPNPEGSSQIYILGSDGGYTLYTGPITIDKSCSVTAMIIGSNGYTMAPVTKEYIVTAPPAGGYLCINGDVMVTDANKDDVLGDGTVSFEPATSTLVLNNANLESITAGSLFNTLTNQTIAIQIIGTNTCKQIFINNQMSSDPTATGLIIKGDGKTSSSLEVEANCGLYQGSVTVKYCTLRTTAIGPDVVGGTFTVENALLFTSAVLNFANCTLTGVKVLDPAAAQFVGLTAFAGVPFTNFLVLAEGELATLQALLTDPEENSMAINDFISVHAPSQVVIGAEGDYTPKPDAVILPVEFSREEGVCLGHFTLTLNNPNEKGTIYYSDSRNSDGFVPYSYGIWINSTATITAYVRYEDGKMSVAVAKTYTYEDYFVIDGTRAVTDANKDDVMGDGGSVKFNPATSTFTLNNAEIGSLATGGKFGELKNRVITFQLKGANKAAAIDIFNEDDDQATAGITFKGDGITSSSLNVEGFCQCSLGTIRIEDCTVVAATMAPKANMATLAVKNAYLFAENIRNFRYFQTDDCKVITPAGARFVPVSYDVDMPNFYNATDEQLLQLQTILKNDDPTALETFISQYGLTNIFIAPTGTSPDDSPVTPEHTWLVPVLSQQSGTFDDRFTLTITNPNGVGTIYYKLKTKDVDPAFQPYTGPIMIDKECTAIAYVDFGDDTKTEEASAEYLMTGYFYVGEGRYPVSDANKDDVFHDGGSLRFDPATSTFYLNNANLVCVLEGPQYEKLVYHTLTFVLEGENHIEYSIIIYNMEDDPQFSGMIFKGSGADVSSLDVGIEISMQCMNNLVFEKCSVTARGVYVGHKGSCLLTVRDANLTAKGIYNFAGLKMEGTQILAPQGAQFMPVYTIHLLTHNFYSPEATQADFDQIASDIKADWYKANPYSETMYKLHVENITIGIPQQLEPPVFSRQGGTCDDEFMLTLTNPNDKGDIYFMDSREGNGSMRLYDEPILVRGRTVITACVKVDDEYKSEVVSHDYQMDGYFLIDGRPVSDTNKDDVLHDGGTVKFDSGSSTFTFNGAAFGDLLMGGRYADLDSKVINFNLKGENMANYIYVDNQTDNPAASGFVFKGDGMKSSSLQVMTDCFPYIGNFTVEDCSFTVNGITPKTSGATLTVRNAQLTAQAIHNYGELVLEGVQLVSPKEARFVPVNKEHVEVPNFYVVTDEQLATLQSLLEGSDYSALLEFAHQHAASPVVIGVEADPDEPEVPEVKEFALSVGGITVDDTNAADIKPYDLKEGSISFDKATATLTFSDVVYKGTSAMYVVEALNMDKALNIRFVGENHISGVSLIHVTGDSKAPLNILGSGNKAQLMFSSQKSGKGIFTEGPGIAIDNIIIKLTSVTHGICLEGEATADNVLALGARTTLYSGATASHISGFAGVTLHDDLVVTPIEAGYDTGVKAITGAEGVMLTIAPATDDPVIQFLYNGEFSSTLDIKHKVSETFTSPTLLVTPGDMQVAYSINVKEKPQAGYEDKPIKVKVITEPFAIQLLNPTEGLGQTDVTIVVQNKTSTVTALLTASFFADEYVAPEVVKIEAPKDDELTKADFSGSSEISESEDLSNTKVGGTLLTLDKEKGDGYDASDKSIVIGSVITEAQLESIIDYFVPGSSAFAAVFKGMTFMIPAGKGRVEIACMTSGDRELCVKVGDKATVNFTQTEHGTIIIDYDCKEDTYVYVFGGHKKLMKSRAASDSADAQEDQVKIYGYTIVPEGVTPEPTAIRDIRTATAPVYYNLNGQRVETPTQGLYIVNGRAVLIK